MGNNFIRRWFVANSTSAEKPVELSVEQLAQAGDAEAQFQLGLEYSTAQDRHGMEFWPRLGTSRPPNKITAWRNSILGQNIGRRKGVTQDATRSLFWLRRAAHSGVAGAQFNLGRVCQRASMDGPTVDAPAARIEAYLWYELAAAQDYAAAKGAFAQLTIKMTRDEVTEARRRVSAWGHEPCLAH